jgi:flagellar protein FlaI
MAEPVTIIDLIRNGTLTAQMAATLWAAMDRGLSLVTVAIPRFAGKTTTTNAILSLLPPDVPVHRLSGDEAEMNSLKKAATGGYLVVGEFSQAPVPHYIWGAPVRRVFDTLTAGYSLATALHAPGLEETFDVICQGNQVTDQAASRIDVMLYIRRFGDDLDTFWRRLAEVHEIDYVQNGKPHGRQLYQWVEEEDRFEGVEAPTFLQGDVAELEARTARLEELSRTGRRGLEDVARLVREYQASTPGAPR